MKTKTEEIKMDDIHVAGRIRKEEGDLSGLMASISDQGLINPVTVMETVENGYLLLAGARRVSACRLLSYDRIRATIVSALDAEEQLKIEIAENEERKEFTMAEKVEFAAKLKEIEAEKARQRMSVYGKAGRDGHGNSDGITEDETEGVANWPHPQKGRSRDIVAKKAGFGSSTTMRRVETIAEKRPDLLEKIDSGEMSINAAHLVATGAAEKKAAPIPAETPVPKMPQPATAVYTPDEPDSEDTDAAPDSPQTQEFKKRKHRENMTRSRRNIISMERPDLMELVENGTMALDSAYERLLKERKGRELDEGGEYAGIPRVPGHVLKAKLSPEEKRKAKEIEDTLVKTGNFTIDTEIPDMFRPSDFSEHERLMARPLYAELFEHDRKAQAAANLIHGELVTKCENYEKRIRSYEENVQALRRQVAILEAQLAGRQANENFTESGDEVL